MGDWVLVGLDWHWDVIVGVDCKMNIWVFNFVIEKEVCCCRNLEEDSFIGFK